MRQLPCIAIILSLLACGESPDAPEMVDEGSWYVTGFEWPHDGEPYESEHFVVYSDAAAREARVALAEIGEELLVVLRQDFEITSDTLFRFPEGQTKIHIYTFRDHSPQEWGGWGYFGGLMIFSLDHPGRTRAGNTEIGNYTRVVKHELMHVVESLLKGDNDPNLVDVWLTEGLAEYVSGGTAGGSVTTLAKLEDLTATYGELNPISMHRYRYPDIEGVIFNYYYPMFELAVGYLLEPRGRGIQEREVRDLFLAVRNGDEFSATFEQRFRIGLSEYEEQFFDLIRAYLNE